MAVSTTVSLVRSWYAALSLPTRYLFLASITAVATLPVCAVFAVAGIGWDWTMVIGAAVGAPIGLLWWERRQRLRAQAP